jgi:hypothetical protein
VLLWSRRDVHDRNCLSCVHHGGNGGGFARPLATWPKM